MTSRPCLRRDDRGVAAVEFAFVLPLILLLLAGGFEVGRAIQVHRAVHMLAAQTARVAADCNDPAPGACQNEPQTIANATGHITPVLAPDRLTLSSGEFRRTGGLVLSLNLNGLLSGNLDSIVLSHFRDGQRGVVVRVVYRHAPLIFPGMAQGFMASLMTFDVTAYGLRS